MGFLALSNRIEQEFAIYRNLPRFPETADVIGQTQVRSQHVRETEVRSGDEVRQQDQFLPEVRIGDEVRHQDQDLPELRSGDEVRQHEQVLPNSEEVIFCKNSKF